MWHTNILYFACVYIMCNIAWAIFNEWENSFFYTGCFPTLYFLKLMDNKEEVFSLFFERGLRFCCPVMFWKTKFLYLCFINHLLESIIRVLVAQKTMEYKTPQQAHSYSNDIYHVYWSLANGKFLGHYSLLVSVIRMNNVGFGLPPLTHCCLAVMQEVIISKPRHVALWLYVCSWLANNLC